MEDKILDVLKDLCNECAKFAQETIDVIIENNLQNEQFALDFADKLNLESGRI